MIQPLANQTAIVTGASRGYGSGIAKRMVEAGAKVWVTSRNEAEITAEAEKIGAIPFTADVSDGKSWDRLFAEVGSLDILVNNAGTGVNIAPVIEQSDDDLIQSIGINLTGAMLGCRRAAEIMVPKNSGTIINIGSVCAKHAWPGWSAYSAAKAGLLHFSKCLLTEVHPHGVRVTSVIPSWGQTEFTESCGLGSRDADILEKCISPAELGQMVYDIVIQPPHLVTEEVTLRPLVQPMTQL